MARTPSRIRADNQTAPQHFDPAKQKFLQKHEQSSESDLLKEQLFQQRIQTKILFKSKEDIKFIKWILLTLFIALIIVVVLLRME